MSTGAGEGLGGDSLGTLGNCVFDVAPCLGEGLCAGGSTGSGGSAQGSQSTISIQVSPPAFCAKGCREDTGVWYVL